MKSIIESSNNSCREYMVTCDYCLNGKGIVFLDFSEVSDFIEDLKKQGWILGGTENTPLHKDFCCKKCKEKYEKHCATIDLCNFDIDK